jgi:NCAIR mutase (PurE)-related protein
MRETLDALAAGDLTPAEAEARLRGYATVSGGTESTGDAASAGASHDDSGLGDSGFDGDDRTGRFDAARETRRGIPEGILAAGKTPAEMAALAGTAVETSGRALVTRADSRTADRVRGYLAEAHPEASVDHDDRARTVLAEAADFDPPSVDADVAVVTGGVADATAAGEATVVARAAGPRVARYDDVGVANLDRALDVVPDLRDADAVVVAAGREGALPTVLAGRLSIPVIGLPVSSGYGVGGDGHAALLGLLQSCTALSVVNVDAGFVAGTQAALIARRVAAARNDTDDT